MAKTSEMPLLNNPSKKIPLTKLAILLLIFLAVVLGIATLFSRDQVNLNFHSTSSIDYSVPLSHVCSNAHELFSCLALVSEASSSFPGGALRRGDLGPLKALLGKSMAHLQSTMKMAGDAARKINDPKHQESIGVCVDLLDMSLDRLGNSLEFIGNNGIRGVSSVHAWLSGVLTNYFTCLDGLNGPARLLFEPKLSDLIARARASLALLVALSPKQPDDLLNSFVVINKLPSWVTTRDRKLLEASPRGVDANVVVAQDGSGDYKAVSDAVAAAPNNSVSRYVIHVKAGTYQENVLIGKKKKNIMLVGDGMSSTVITGSLNFVDGTTTFRTATVAVDGDGFMAQDIWFQNTAGPQKHQAVALRVSSDQSVINRCQIDAYQDTLYAHSLRQFYRDCQVLGTIDFIFGNAAVVFQGCNITARKPMSQQFNTITAQGREDPNQNTGTSLQGCRISPSADLLPAEASFRTYFGRPWKNYSRAVVMQSHVDGFVSPAGWVLWDQFTDTAALYYGEYANTGPGAGVGQRVTWPGFHVITNASEARKFTVTELIQGDLWLQSTGVTFSEGL